MQWPTAYCRTPLAQIRQIHHHDDDDYDFFAVLAYVGFMLADLGPALADLGPVLGHLGPRLAHLGTKMPPRYSTLKVVEP